MIEKRILPESFDFGMPSVEMIGAGSKGLDKTAMVKRASAFEDVLSTLDKKAGRTYLHVITTGAFEKYGANANGDGWNGEAMTLRFPEPENAKKASMELDGGLSKYHDDTYMKDGAVYQEHQTKRAGVDPSGEVISARYNPLMKRGELIIAVDTRKWATRLQKKASGKDIYLSIGADVPYDVCNVCGRQAKTASQHCDHFNKQRLQILDSGERVCVLNDQPSFYDISGVDVPADRIAFVLNKVASGATFQEAYVQSMAKLGSRVPILFSKASAALAKLSRLKKRIECVAEGDDTDDVFSDSADAQRNFILRVESYPTDEVISNCHRKGILLSPGMLFKLLGRDCSSSEGQQMLDACDDGSCGDCLSIIDDMNEDDYLNTVLQDGTFDQVLPVDLSLDRLLEMFVPEFGTSNPAIQNRTIRIIISGAPRRPLRKAAAFNKQATQALRSTYGRYLVSFAANNGEAECMNGLRKLAMYGKNL